MLYDKVADIVLGSLTSLAADKLGAWNLAARIDTFNKDVFKCDRNSTRSRSRQHHRKHSSLSVFQTANRKR